MFLAGFDGPFDLLLTLLGNRELDVAEISLSRVTDEFISYLKGLDADEELEQASEFLVVAATLLDMKVAGLLPQGRAGRRRVGRPARGARPAVRPAAAVPGVQRGVGVVRAEPPPAKTAGTCAPCGSTRSTGGPCPSWSGPCRKKTSPRSRCWPSRRKRSRTWASTTCTRRSSRSASRRRCRHPAASSGQLRVFANWSPGLCSPASSSRVFSPCSRTVPARRPGSEQLEPLGELTLRCDRGTLV